MYSIAMSKKFEKKVKKIIKFDNALYLKIKELIKILALDPHNPKLKSHKLSGNLKGLYSISCGLDCRIIFEIDFQNKLIILVDFGTHDNVY